MRPLPAGGPVAARWRTSRCPQADQSLPAGGFAVDDCSASRTRTWTRRHQRAQCCQLHQGGPGPAGRCAAGSERPSCHLVERPGGDARSTTTLSVGRGVDAAHGDPPRAGGAILDDGPRRRWQKTGAAIGVSVNISARNLTAENLPELVCAAIDRAGIPAACLELESTGSALMGDLERAQQRLGELRALGLRLAIDDFGTGMSSLSYLRDLPVHVLKIDRGFVTGMLGDATGTSIVRAVVDLGGESRSRDGQGVEDVPGVRDQPPAAGCGHSGLVQVPGTKTARCQAPRFTRGMTRAVRLLRPRARGLPAAPAGRAVSARPSPRDGSASTPRRSGTRA